jgi:putative ATP-dependent endonuclease of OLD family
MNVIVGDNECGKSTLLEAINLALTGQLSGRPIQSELHPHLFNLNAVHTYLDAVKAGAAVKLPSIVIEIYFADSPTLAKLQGTNNSQKEDAAGVKLVIEFNDEYRSELAAYVSDRRVVKTIPVEYYIVRWRSFADNEITSRSIPLKPSLIDTSAIRNTAATQRYIADIVKEALDPKQQIDLALSYRLMKDRFLEDPKIQAINSTLASKRGEVTDKTLTVSLDTSARASWEAGVMPHLDQIPLTLIGKGEQSTVKIKLAMESLEESRLEHLPTGRNLLGIPRGVDF